MTIDEIVTLIQAVSENGLTSFEYEEGNQKLVLKKKKKKVSPMTMAVPAAQPEQGAAISAGVSSVGNISGGEQEKEPVDIGSDNVVVSPLVGTFYASSSPEAEPFVKVGDHVKKGQVLGIIEAMKLMNEVEADCEGVVEEVLVENEQMVEFGQPLFKIRGKEA